MRRSSSTAGTSGPWHAALVATYNPSYIEKVSHAVVAPDEVLIRALYYDCAPFVGEVKLPVSGESHRFDGSDGWLRDLAARDLFAVRRGVLKFRGFKPRKLLTSGESPTDADFKPDFQQKGVDMRIGLDIATFSVSRAVHRIILISGDTDCIPAMKHGRKAGLQIALVSFSDQPAVASELLWHSDFHRVVPWPAQ